MIDKYKTLLQECELDPFEFFKSRPNFMREVRIALHPDIAPDKDEATRIIAAFSSFEEVKPDYISKFRIVRHLAKGDLSNILLASGNISDSLSDHYVIMKKPLVKAGNHAKTEYNTITNIREAFSDTDICLRMMPRPIKMVEDCTLYDCNNSRNPFKDYISGVDVISKHGDDLDSRHIVWMAKRALSLLGRIHTFGYVHGAITPAHLVFNKVDHGLLCLGWLHSGKAGDTIKFVPKEYMHYYPDSTKKSKKLTKDLDIYMLARSMLDIGGKKCHPRIAKFFKSCVDYPPSMRPDSAYVLHDELAETAKSVFGTPKFINLV